MKRIFVIFFICCVLIVITFLMFQDLENWIVTHINSEQTLTTYIGLSFIFMAMDTLLPVSSSLLMILNGKILGVYFGTLLSLISNLVSSVFGFYLGKSANPYLNKFFSPQDKDYSNKLFQKFGNMAITISKALPVISEAISFVAGTTAIPFKTFLLYSAIGHFVVAAIYAYLGSFSNSINSGLVTVITIIFTVLSSWVVQLFLKNQHQNRNQSAKFKVN